MARIFVSPFVSPGWVKMCRFVITREEAQQLLNTARYSDLRIADDISGFVRKRRFGIRKSLRLVAFGQPADKPHAHN